MSAVRVPVAAEPLLRGRRVDYADAFETTLAADDTRSPEELLRASVVGASPAVRRLVLVVHRHVLRLRLAPQSAPGHLLGWKLTTSSDDVAALEAVSPLLGEAMIVARRRGATATATTYLTFGRPALARAVWAAVGPLHRFVAPYLLDRLAGGTSRRTASVIHDSTRSSVHP